MRLGVFCFAVLLTSLQVFAFTKSKGQDINTTKIDFTIKDQSLLKAIEKIQLKSGLSIFYPSEKIIEFNHITIVADANRTIATTLQLILANTGLNFRVDNGIVIVYEKDESDLKSSKDKIAPVVILGTVSDEHGRPIPGVNVKLKSTTQGVVTNQDGKYQILIGVEKEPTLVFSFIGYTSQEIKIIGNSNPLNVVLKEDISKLDEVQVTAYGQTTKRLNTGSISTIKADDIAKTPATNVLQALDGRVPGLFITQQTGQPGSTFNLKIRGTNSLGGGINGSQPLVIVDGVAYPTVGLPMLSQVGVNLNNIIQGGNGLNFLNPQMIESIDVLKDADATSIYGSRGAYGVILITTKKGKAGAAQLNVNSYAGLTVKGKVPQMLNTDQYLMIRNEALKNDGTKPGASDLDLNGTWSPTNNTDWVKEFNGNFAAATNTNLTYSGGNGTVNYLIGSNYSTQQNIQKNGGSDNIGGLNFNINTANSSKKIFVNLTGSFSTNSNTINPNDFTSGIFTQAPNAPPLLNSDGSLNFTDYAQNPANGLKTFYKNVTQNLLANTDIRWLPVKGLTLKAGFSFNDLDGSDLAGNPSTYFKPGTNFQTNSGLSLYSIKTWTLEPNANYVHQLGAKGSISFTVGATLQNTVTTSQVTTGSDFISDDLLVNPTFASAANITTAYNKVPRKYMGYFAIANYNWDNKYLINLSGRYDGSSRFGVNNRFGTFGSVGAAYIISEEPWFKNILPVVSFAKVHGSFGTVGGDAIPDYSFANIFASNSTAYEGNLGITQVSLANPYINWEKNTKKELGVNLAFLKDRISIDALYYKARTTNQLISFPLPILTGFPAITTNLDAVIDNSGYEFTLNTKNVAGKKFSWSTSFNITLPKSILTAYPNFNTNQNLYVLGKSVTGVKVYHFAGVNPATGVYNFTNRNGVTGQFNPFLGASLDQTLDKTDFIDLTPKFYGGFANSFKYQNFTLDVLFSFKRQWGKNIYGTYATIPGFFNVNETTQALQRWQKPGDVTNIPKASASVFGIFDQSNFVQSSGAYSEFTYARLANLSFGYQVPVKLANKLHLQGLRFYLQGQNLLTISKNNDNGYDPENFGVGVAPLRVFTAGLNLTL